MNENKSKKGKESEVIASYVYVGKCTLATWGTLLVAHLVEALRYKPEGRGFDSRWCH